MYAVRCLAGLESLGGRLFEYNRKSQINKASLAQKLDGLSLLRIQIQLKFQFYEPAYSFLFTRGALSLSLVQMTTSNKVSLKGGLPGYYQNIYTILTDFVYTSN